MTETPLTLRVLQFTEGLREMEGLGREGQALAAEKTQEGLLGAFSPNGCIDLPQA